MRKLWIRFLFGILTAGSLGAQANYWPLTALDFSAIEPGQRQNTLSRSRETGEEANPLSYEKGYRPLRFYPVGWSDEGKFAYVLVESFGERGGWWPSVHLCIMDMVSDVMVYEEKVAAENHPQFETLVRNGQGGEERKRSDDPLVGVYSNWKIIARAYEEELSRLGIGKIGEGDFVSFPLGISGVSYEAYPFGEESGEGYFSEYGIRIGRGDGGVKTIFSGQSDRDDLSPVVGLTVFGAFKSPYENRIAVLYGIADTGWEGTPWWELHLSGSHLGLGFK
ncbi:MAG: hypothetical protein PQJ60_02285 [Spirochaetales bacterium]|nr:hypothetical protein [Spirochaetales bacterium]